MEVEAQFSAVAGMKKQLDAGQVALVDLLKQEQSLVIAQTNAAKSHTKYVISVYNVKYIMGELTAKKLNLNVKYFDPEGRQRINRNNVPLDENLLICQEVCHQALKLKEQISKIDTKVGFLQEYLLCIEQ
jgi:hypothetical protein